MDGPVVAIPAVCDVQGGDIDGLSRHRVGSGPGDMDLDLVGKDVKDVYDESDDAGGVQGAFRRSVYDDNAGK